MIITIIMIQHRTQKKASIKWWNQENPRISDKKSAGNAFQAAIEDAEFGKEPK